MSAMHPRNWKPWTQNSFLESGIQENVRSVNGVIDVAAIAASMRRTSEYRI